MRTIVDLPEDQVAALKELGKQSRLSRAELMRQAVAEFLLKHRSASAESAFGLWREQPRDGLDYERRLREEWSR